MGKYRRAVFVVAYKKEKNKVRYVILKRKLHWKGWEFPKGGINPGEKLLKVAEREVKEETGLKAKKVKRFNFSGKYKYHKKLLDRPGFIGQSFSLYAAEVPNGKIKVDKREHSRGKWVDFEQAVKKVHFPNQKKSLKIVNDWLKNDRKIQKH